MGMCLDGLSYKKLDSLLRWWIQKTSPGNQHKKTSEVSMLLNSIVGRNLVPASKANFVSKTTPFPTGPKVRFLTTFNEWTSSTLWNPSFNKHIFQNYRCPPQKLQDQWPILRRLVVRRTGAGDLLHRPQVRIPGEQGITPTAQRLLPKPRHWNLHVQWVHAHDWSENSAVLAYTKRYIWKSPSIIPSDKLLSSRGSGQQKKRIARAKPYKWNNQIVSKLHQIAWSWKTSHSSNKGPSVIVRKTSTQSGLTATFKGLPAVSKNLERKERSSVPIRRCPRENE